MTFRTFIHAELVLSPLNVRTNEEDANATDALEQSILVSGLLLPLVVHTLTEEQSPLQAGRVAVLAGGRRWRAIGRLIERGAIPADWPIDCVVRELTSAEITELSLAENLLRRELRPYEIHAAIARAADQGAGAGEIAANIGQRIEWVHQQLRLGHLAPEIFAAYAEGNLSADQARAYAATEDHELQRAAWQHFTGSGSLRHYHGASEIRAFMKIDDRELARLLRFVGDQAYRKAGGTFELDLFFDGPEQRGRVVDEGLLRQLAEARLDQVRKQARIDVQDKDLRFVPEPPKYGGYTDSALEIVLESGRPRPPNASSADVVATIDLDDNGQAHARYWWASRAAKSRAKKSGAAAGVASPPPSIPGTGQPVPQDGAFDQYGYEQAARAAVKDEHGLTADGLQLMRSLRRDLLRAVLLRNAGAGGTLGRDYVVWSALRQELGRDKRPQAGARGIHNGWNAGDDEPREIDRDWLAEVEVRRAWHGAVEDIRRQPYMEIDDPAEAFAAFYALGRDDKAWAGAVLAGCALIRSLDAQGWRVPVHDRLADLAGASDDQLRRFWTPDAAFAGLFPKLKRLELAQPHVGEAEFKGWHKLDDKVLSGAVAGALELAEGWMHPLLSFGVPKEEPSGDDRSEGVGGELTQEAALAAPAAA